MAAGWEPKLDERGLPTPEGLPQEIIDFYDGKPSDWFPTMMDSFAARQRQIAEWPKMADRFAIADAVNQAYRIASFGSPGEPDNFPVPIKNPPEVDDFKYVKRDTPRKFKSAKHAKELIKTIAHQFGATLVSFAKLNPDWVWDGQMRGMPNMGRDSWGSKIPKHWKTVVCIGAPMRWDAMYAAIGYSTSYGGYHEVRESIGKLGAFLGELGIASRVQAPGNDYDLMITPHCIASGMGESCRSGMMMTPELGTNCRPAGLIIDLDLEDEYDEPVDMAMIPFCRECKICAEACPSGSISFSDGPDHNIRGYKQYLFNEESCYNMWQRGPTSTGDGCRVCVAVCPYTRKNNWIHTLMRKADPRDPTGLVRKSAIAMQHNFFYYPEPDEYRAEWDGGNLAGYHQPPKWLRSEEYFADVEKTWEYNGNWEAF